VNTIYSNSPRPLSILVTGASSGIGAHTAARLAADGHRVAGAARRVAEVAALPGVAPVHLDLEADQSIEAAALEAAEAIGPIDVLINNAGIQRRHALVDFPQHDWDAIIATNLTAPYLVSQAVLPQMIEAKRGKIIHIASLMSELARPSVVPYIAAKGGIRQLTRGMAVELAPHNIQVNAIAPGYFATEMNRALLDDAKFTAWVKARTPAGRWGEPEEISGLAIFLASSAANYVTGQIVMIDGGMSVAL